MNLFGQWFDKRNHESAKYFYYLVLASCFLLLIIYSIYINIPLLSIIVLVLSSLGVVFFLLIRNNLVHLFDNKLIKFAHWGSILPWMFGIYNLHVNNVEDRNLYYLITILTATILISSAACELVISFSAISVNVVIGTYYLNIISDSKVDVIIFVFGYSVAFIIFGRFLSTMVREKHIKETIQKISFDILRGKNFSEAINNIVPQSIISMFEEDVNVYILETINSNNYLRVVGGAGKYSPLINKEFPAHLGITGKALQDNSVIMVSDVSTSKYYLSLSDMQETKSEIAVPLIYENKIFGVLDIQSSKEHAFSRADVSLLSSIGEYISAALFISDSQRNFREASDFWETLTTTQMSSEIKLFNEFSIFINKSLPVDMLLYYPLTPTGFPQRPLGVESDLLSPLNIFGEQLSPSSLIGLLISKWEERHISYDEMRQENKEYFLFIEREEILSLHFFPVGLPQAPAGALILGFRKKTGLDDYHTGVVRSFALIMANVAWRNRNEKLVYESFAKPEINLHNLVGRHGFKLGARSNIENLISDYERGEIPLPTLLGGIREAVIHFDSFIRDLNLAQATTPPTFNESPLYAELTKFSYNFTSTSINFHVDPEIESENRIVLLAIYRIITEAINNAVIHANAKEIFVDVSRNNFSINVSIQNDGESLKEGATSRKSRKGIYFLKSEMEQLFNASFEISSIEKGARFEVSIPAIRIKYNE